MTLSRRAMLSLSLAPILSASDNSDWILKLGGKVERDASGNVIAVNLGQTWVNNTEMLDLVSLKKLERLDLSHTRISDEGLLYIRPARQIQDLNLLYAEMITDLGLNAIKEWKSLKRLNVRGTRIADETLGVVGKLTQLESLDVANTGITDSGLEALAGLTSLKQLALGRARMGDAALSVLRLMSTTLESLDLSGARDIQRNQRNRGNGPTQEALWKLLAELKELRVLKLGTSDVDGDALRNMGVALTKVERLDLEGCQRVNDQAVNELAGWKSLKYLDLQETKATQAAVDNFKKANPAIKILYTAAPVAANATG